MYLWDAGNVDHIALHNVDPHEAEEVLENGSLDMPRQIRNGEIRFPHIGETNTGRVLLVIVVQIEDDLRVVTAYEPAKALRQFYRNERG